ncbi:MAG: hypothetical protein ACUVXB_17160 [Bryobacteraceae bacterium]
MQLPMAGLMGQREAVAPQLGWVLLGIEACVHADTPRVDPQRPVNVPNAEELLHVVEL